MNCDRGTVVHSLGKKIFFFLNGRFNCQLILKYDLLTLKIYCLPTCNACKEVTLIRFSLLFLVLILLRES